MKMDRQEDRTIGDDAPEPREGERRPEEESAGLVEFHIVGTCAPAAAAARGRPPVRIADGPRGRVALKTLAPGSREHAVYEHLSGMDPVIRLLGRRGNVLILEYADGFRGTHTLSDAVRMRWLRRGIRAYVFSRATICRQLAAAARALRTVQEAGVVHGDVGPDQFVFRADGTLALLDFEYSGPPGQRGRPVGKPLVASARQLRGEPLDPRMDLYAFSGLVWMVLGGTHPLARLTPEQGRAHRLENGDPLLPRLENADLGDLPTLLEAALDPDWRAPASLGAIERALEKAARRLDRRAARRRRLLLLLGLFFASVIGCAGLGAVALGVG